MVKKHRLSMFILTLIIALSAWSVYVWNNNTYMEYRDVPVTFIDKYTLQACSKHGCSVRTEGLFKTEDGYVFSRSISSYMYRQMRLGEKFDLNIRQMDIQQTAQDNIYWFFGPVVLYIVTFVIWCLSLFHLFDEYTKYKGKRHGY